MNDPITNLNPKDCILKQSRIDIWQFPLTTLFDNAASVLDKTELIRAKRFYFERHQRRFTVARAMLRHIIAQYVNIHPANLLFSYTKYGKPYLSENTEQIQFNLSHSCDLALLAIGSEFQLGIDVEFFSARSYDDMAKHLFSENEKMQLNQIPRNLKPWTFFRIWAQKEAFIKACGLGLSYPTTAINMPIFCDQDKKLVDPLEHTSWKLMSFTPLLACQAALCHHPAVTDIRYIKLPSLDHFFYEKLKSNSI